MMATRKLLTEEGKTSTSSLPDWHPEHPLGEPSIVIYSIDLHPFNQLAATAERVVTPSGAAAFSLCSLRCSVQAPAAGSAC